MLRMRALNYASLVALLFTIAESESELTEAARERTLGPNRKYTYFWVRVRTLLKGAV